MDYKTAKQIDLIDYLASLGFNPATTAKNDSNNVWYLSPFGEEKTPSFKVNRSKNVFYCHSSGFGGTIIDFAMHLYHTDVSGALKMIEEKTPYIRVSPKTDMREPAPENKIMILSATSPITSNYLVNYLEGRCIDLAIAQNYCHQVRYSNKGRDYLAIGFKNDEGGFELRSPDFKGSSAPKAITFIDRGQKSVIVVEGFVSFLSLIQLSKTTTESNYLILNSLSMLKSAIPVLLDHSHVALYLDNDIAGRKATALLTTPKDNLPEKWQHEKILEQLKPGNTARFQDMSAAFVPHKDCNAQLMALHGKINKGRELHSRKNTGMEPT
jgi:hypothetical protein